MELLGPPGVRDGARRPKVAGRQQALLAALALHARATVSADRLVDVVWREGELPADPSNALQQRISALRRVVDPERRGDVLVQQHHGYCLYVDDAAIDACVFSERAAAGRRQLAAGDAAAAERTIGEALTLWRGAALDGYAHEPWAMGEARRLEEERLTAIEDRVEAALALGRAGDVVAELTDLLADHPLRERLCGQLMRALYASGRQADALALYDRTRRLLADELGVDPGPELQALYGHVLDQDEQLVPGPSATPAPPSVPARGNVPIPTSSIVGREGALDRVVQLLDHARLVTLTGPGGAGKTTLAVEAARRRPPPADGAWLVELAPVTTPEAVPTAVAEALGLVAGGIGGGTVGPEDLARALRGTHRLVVLDNCEHVAGAVARLAERLLAGADGLQVLATSREPLHVAGEVLWSVPPLGLPDEGARVEAVLDAPAVRLLVERARGHVPDFALTPETAGAAAQVVRRLDGIPLAIELAAARLRVLSVQELADGLEDRFRLLVGRSRTAPSRQRTLRGALDWSWDLLDAPLRRAWAALSVARGPFEAPMAAALLAAAGVEDAPLDVVTDLVDRSLLGAVPGAPRTRYRMLESVRDYGLERLGELGVAEAVHERHADAVEAALAGCHAATSPGQFAVDLDRLAGWLDDARAAMGWAHERADAGRVQRIAGLLGWVWWLRGLAAEGIRWLDRGLGASPDVVPDGADPRALLWAAGLRSAGADPPQAARWGALALRAAATPTDAIVARVFGAIARANAGQLDAAVAALDSCVGEAEATGGWPLGFARLISAQLARLQGRLDLARTHAEEALGLLTSIDVDWARAYALDPLIDHAELHGDYVRARALAQEALEVCRRHRFPELEAGMLIQLGFATHELGDEEAAAAFLADAVHRAAAVGRTAGLGYAHIGAGVLARRRLALDDAERHLTEGQRIVEEAGVVLGVVWARTELAHVAALRGQPAAAAAHATAALDAAVRVGEPRATALALEALAGAQVATAPERALTSLATAWVLREASGTPTPPPEQRDLARLRAWLRDGEGPPLDDEGWQAAVDRARADLPARVAQLAGISGGA